jgi:glycine betaine/proline transport system permease protein
METNTQTIHHPLPQLAKAKRRSILFWSGLLLLFVILPFIINQASDVETFPEQWNIGLRHPIDNVEKWVIENRKQHPLFLYFFNPISDSIDIAVRALESFLVWLPWLLMIVVTFALAYRASGWKLAVFCALGMVFMGLIGLWKESMQTLALMIVSVLLSLIIGVPIGIASGLSKRFEAFLRPILDIMQTMPSFVYLIPVVLFFGIARVPSVIATVIYALPPAIRYTSLGIKQVPHSSIEAARAFGSTARQLLFKVRLPLALPAVMAGVNQTIMMAFGMVVIAALIGAGGLGRNVMQALQRRQVGKGLEAGLAIALMAIILDRISYGFSQRKVTHPRASRRFWFITLGIIVMLLLIHVSYPLNPFPEAWRINLSKPVDQMVKWSRDNLYQIGNLPLGTKPTSDFLIIYVLKPLTAFFHDFLPWPLLIIGVGFLVTMTTDWRLGLFAAVSFFVIGLLGMWEPTLVSLSQVIVGTIITVILALILGIWSARNETVRKVLEPILDLLQTIPSFIYLIPVVMLFSVGFVPGLIASVLYALPPGIRMISLGIRQVSSETIEAARAFGSTPRQMLYKVQLPLALPSIMLGINQIIMMILAMVIIAGLVGGGGLGLEAVNGLARSQTGQGMEAGIAIVLLAMVLDRMTQSWARRGR